jgi:hypothetical protein
MAIIYSYPIATPQDTDLLIISRTPTDPDEISNYSVSMSSVADYVIDEAFNGTDRYIPRFNGTSSLVNSVIYEDSNGTIGIGTASPSQKLHVVGNARVTGAYRDSLNSPGTSGQILSSTVTGTDWIDGTAIPGLVDGTGTANYVARWTGTESIGTGVIYDNGTNVGISATSLYSKLHIGNSSNGNNNLLTMESSGPVWVHLKTPSNNQSQIGFGESQYVDQNTRGRIVYNSSTTTANNYMSFTTNFAEVMRITNSNVGIGTTSPSQKLDVNGDIGIKHAIVASFDDNNGNLSIGSDAGKINLLNDSLVIDYSTNVGIGTTSPASKLEVDGGDIEIDDSASGLILRSPNGTRYRVQVDNSGNLTTTAI